jgi:hypothetical protein
LECGRFAGEEQIMDMAQDLVAQAIVDLACF